jgi:dienelactone hydrolase
MMKNIVLSICLLSAYVAHAQTLLKIDNQGVQLDGYFYATSSPKAPTIVALHGCGGMLNPSGKPNLRTVGYAKFLTEQGWHVLFLDSFTARGVKSVCGSGGNVPPSLRVTDVQAAVAALAKRDDVDASRIGILGWSHGGSTTLLANEKNVPYAAGATLRAALAFYPGCGDGIGRIKWQPARPILMQLGSADDWTDPVPCQRLAAQWKDWVQQDTYANAHHGFDSDDPVRPIQLTTPRGGKTVHAGGEPAAKVASQAKLIAFFKEHFK